MQQKELATLLDISPAMVSRLAKRGMPTDTVERAERWRRRHLEPGRVKGSRVDTIRKAPEPVPKTTRPTPAQPAPISVDDMMRVAGMVDDAIERESQYATAIRTHQLRLMLRDAPASIDPVFSIQVWLCLVDYVLHLESAARNAPNMADRLTPGEFGLLAVPTLPWDADDVMYQACDFDDNALNGYPYCADDDAETEI